MRIKECDGGCMVDAGSINGVGNPTPASVAAMTGAEQCSPEAIGSGDKFGSAGKMSTQAPNKKKMTVKFVRRKKK